MFNALSKTVLTCFFVSGIAYAAYSLPNMNETKFQEWAKTTAYLKNINKKNAALCADGKQGMPYSKEFLLNDAQVSFTAHISCPDMVISREIIKIDGANIGTSRKDEALNSIISAVLGEETGKDFNNSTAEVAKVLGNSRGIPTSINVYRGDKYTYVITNGKNSNIKYVNVCIVVI